MQQVVLVRIHRGRETSSSGAILCKRHDRPRQLCIIPASPRLLLGVNTGHPTTMHIHEHTRLSLRNARLVDCPRPYVGGHLGYVYVVKSDKIEIPSQGFGNCFSVQNNRQLSRCNSSCRHGNVANLRRPRTDPACLAVNCHSADLSLVVRHIINVIDLEILFGAHVIQVVGIRNLEVCQG